MDFRMLGQALAASGTLLLAMPVSAQQPSTPADPIVLQHELLPDLTYDAVANDSLTYDSVAYDSSWRVEGDARERSAGMWPIALIGPVAMILIVTVLGLTITVRSLRKDVRRQRTLNRYWHHGAMSRASRGSRG